ncbi:hypothetical protein EG329_004589 [Mollisiaceae sp. DMI_Dod_QoI]|nr:hypothetical protein EG329_004589 [Helotiales sp. DMI_Dod_QoI]
MLSSMNRLLETLARLRDFSWNAPDWQEPEDSIGIQCNSFGPYQCWEADGPAKRLFADISADIGALLHARAEEIDYGEPVAGHVLMFGMYMIGKDRSKARPTLLFSHPRPKPRQRAKQFVKESIILQGYPKIVLAESREAPMAQGLVGYRTNSPSQSPTTSTYAKSSAVFAADPDLVYILPHHLNSERNAEYIPIITSLGKRAIISLIVSYRGERYGVTVAHAFTAIQAKDQDGNSTGTSAHHGLPQGYNVEEHHYSEDNVEFAFDDEDEEKSTFGEDEGQNIAITSTGSVSSKSSSLFAPYSPSDSPEHDRLDATSVDITTTKSSHSEKIQIGELFISSITENGVGLDWALIQTTISLAGVGRNVQLTSSMPEVSDKIPNSPRQVMAINHDGKILRGKLSPNPTMMRMPFCKEFQEVWTVRFDDICKEGDCGSWVYGEENGDIYGQIVAGHPSSNVAYIVPASKIFHAMRKELDKIELYPRLRHQRIQPSRFSVFVFFLALFFVILSTLLYLLILLLAGIQHQSMTTIWIGEGNVPPRGTRDIFWSCLATIAACIWTTKHLNISELTVTGTPTSGQLWTKAKWLIFIILAPELRLAAAFEKDTIARDDADDQKLDISSDYSHRFVPDRAWAQSEISFPTNYRRLVIQKSLENKATGSNGVGERKAGKKWDPASDLANQPSNTFMKLLVSIQLTWFFLQVTIRYFSMLPITPLEFSTYVLALCSISIYFPQWVHSNQNAPCHTHTSRSRQQGRVRIQERILSTTDYMHYMHSTLYKVFPVSDLWLWSLSLAGFILGAIYSLTWDISFPSATEKLLWRISSLVLLGPIALLFLTRCFNKLSAHKFFQNMFGKEQMENLEMISLVLTIVLYLSARVFLFLEPFRMLLSMDAEAYVVTPWLSWFPHL